MTEEEHTPRREEENQFSREIGRKADRKIIARRRKKNPIWEGLGTMGMVGWSVALPTLIGALVGAWLDNTIGGSISWTLTLLVAGLALGCINAWQWVQREQVAMEEERRAEEEEETIE